MACDAQSVETLLVNTDKYYSLSHRQWLEWLCQLVINAAGTTVTAAINLAASNKMAALSDRNLEECRIAVFTAALFDAQHIINEIATQKYPSLDRHDLMCATIAAYCAAAGGSAQTVETLSVGNGYFKLSQRNDTLAIDAVICAAGGGTCTAVTAVALSPGITGMSERHLKEVICAVINSAAGPPVVPCQVPTGLAAVWNLDTTTTVTWDAVPAGMTSTEIWKSADNIGFVLADTVAAPTHTDTLPASPFPLWIKIRFTVGATDCNFTTSVQAASPTNPLLTSWLARITANGGAAPSNNTQTAINTFFNSLDAASVTSQCITCNMFVPDNLIAASTPLIAAGQDPWGLHTFVLGDLSVNGFQSIGNQYFDPGVVSGTSAMTTTSQSLAFYDYIANINVAGTEIAAIEGTTGSFFVSALLAGGINCDADLTGSGGRINVATPGNGFYLASRIASNDVKVYFASSVSAFASIGSSAGASSALLPSIGYLVFATNNNGSVIQGAQCLMSFAWFGKGLTSTQGQALYNAVQACRVALGGGFR